MKAGWLIQQIWDLGLSITGDRVALYVVGQKKHCGSVLEIRDSATILIISTKDQVLYAHPKQCRKLVKKNDTRKRVWILSDNFGLGDFQRSYTRPQLDRITHSTQYEGKWIEFIEVTKPKKDIKDNKSDKSIPGYFCGINCGG